MKRKHDSGSKQARRPGEAPLAACEFCTQTGGKILWRDAQCRVVLVDDPDYPGFCRVIWNSHVREMTDLAAPAQRHCMRVVLAAEAALRTVLDPHKINLASLGNMTPHVHWHVIARFESDAHFPNPIWGARRRTPPVATQTASDVARGLTDELRNLIGKCDLM